MNVFGYKIGEIRKALVPLAVFVVAVASRELGLTWEYLEEAAAFLASAGVFAAPND